MRKLKLRSFYLTPEALDITIPVSSVIASSPTNFGGEAGGYDDNNDWYGSGSGGYHDNDDWDGSGSGGYQDNDNW